MIEPTYTKSLEFLQQWRPDGPWVLVATSVDKRTMPIVRTFMAEDQEGDDALAFLEKYGLEKNLYFSVNPTRRPVFKKASREDIREMSWLHVDLDPGTPPEGADHTKFIAKERKAQLKLLRNPPNGVPKPTCIVDSGGGYWGFWKLKEPFQIEGAEDKYEDAKRYNQKLELDFKADHCHNVDRIARLPGTVNHPDEKKIQKGRKEALASVLEWHPSRVYDLSQFKAAAPKAEIQTGLVQLSDEIVPADIDDLPKGVPLLCKKVIVQGCDPDHPERWDGDRSKALFWVCNELVRAGCSDDMVYAVITNKAHGISDHIHDQSNPMRYAARQIERAKTGAISDELLEMNERHSVILNVNGKCRILTEIPDPDMGRTEITYSTFEDLRNSYMNRAVEVIVTDAKGNAIPKSIPLGQWWLAHPHRRQYDTVVFSPGQEIDGCYNLWRGFAYSPREGVCEKWMQHVRDHICSQSDELFNYLLGWMARAVQRPEEQGHVAVVMRGGRGVGKGKFATTFMRLFGRHGVPVSNPSHLTGKFNAHLRDCVVLFGDEAFAARDKEHESVLKALVTEDLQISEQKGFDARPARNHVHLILASNDQWVVPAGNDERRFFVLDVVNPEHTKDTVYFGAIQRELDGGGYEALLYFLMNYDLENYNVRNVPETKALRAQKRMSMTPLEEWWYTALREGCLEGEDWPELAVRQNVRHSFTAYCRVYGIRPKCNDSMFTEFLDRILPGGVQSTRARGTRNVIQADGTTIEVKRPRAYLMPSVHHCRDHFDGLFGGGMEWPDPPNSPNVELLDSAF